jgi:hypothetical protein
LIDLTTFGIASNFWIYLLDWFVFQLNFSITHFEIISIFQNILNFCFLSSLHKQSATAIMIARTFPSFFLSIRATIASRTAARPLPSSDFAASSHARAAVHSV